MSPGQRSCGGCVSRMTITWNEQLVVWPAPSVAVQITVLVPGGNTVLGVTGMPMAAARKQLIVRFGPHRLVPVMDQFTVAPLEQVIVRMSDGHVSSMQGQHVAVTVSSARRPVGPGGPRKLGALVT